jgi:hypothetical protein
VQPAEQDVMTQPDKCIGYTTTRKLIVDHS